MARRRLVIGGLTVLCVLLAMVLLWEVVGTVFFAITVAYILGPVRRQLRQRGLSRRASAALATGAGLFGTVAVLSPLAIVLFLRLESIIAFIERAPEAITVELWRMRYTVVTDDAVEQMVGLLVSVATSVAASIPVLLVKLMLFVFVVYSLLHYEKRTRRSLMALVPPGYRDLAEALHARARRTLYGIYVVQAATGVATFLIAIPVFVMFGYPSPLGLATLAGVLQFIPVLGPSVLIAVLVGYHLLMGEVVAAVGILVVGGLLIAWGPDLVVRPWVAAEAAHLPSSLYFIGFVGGVLTIGALGVIVGPLVVAIAAELAAQLSDELNLIHVNEEAD